MVHPVRHDHIELSYAYSIALVAVIFFALVSLPIDTSHLGLIVPHTEEEKKDIYTSDAFAQVTVKAKAYVVYDIVDKKVIASKNGYETLPLASLTKVMTAVTALNHHDRKTKIVISPSSIEGSYDLGLRNGQVWTLDELLKYTLVFSSNDGAWTVANALGGRRVFIDQMNTESALLGLGLIFTDPAGLDSNGNLGGQGTAVDVAKLFVTARRLYPDIFEATTHARVTVRAGTDKLTGVPNTNQDIENLFGAEASKTGFTDDAGGNLGVIVDVSLGHPVALVVLGSTREERFSDMKTLYNALLESLK
jgi:D-alanyl-D-alanine carboxypeptidase